MGTLHPMTFAALLRRFRRASGLRRLNWLNAPDSAQRRLARSNAASIVRPGARPSSYWPMRWRSRDMNARSSSNQAAAALRRSHHHNQRSRRQRRPPRHSSGAHTSAP